MKQVLTVYCSRCGEFIGDLGNIDECPVCGMQFVSVEVIEPEEEDE